MSLQVLTVGDHPNLAFYAWRLHATKACTVTMVAPGLDPQVPIKWQSQLGSGVFQPHLLAQSLGQLDPSSEFDVVILSVSNLHSFQDWCTNLGPFLHPSSLVVVESTGYVSLEPFVVSSYPKQKKVTVCSIMNEADVKRHPHSNTYTHTVLNQDQRIYFGTCTNESKSLYKVGDSEYYAKFYKLLQLVQEQSGGSISLLKSNNYKEFMTYQWKLALPRIVLNPLSVIFEEPYPASLNKQILAKPLISGLVNEIFKIIKKMECKLIKGFENEANIMKNWSAHFPASRTAVDPEFSNTNAVFYNFYHQLDVDVDLLLLQPILLGDDHGVRTPYLENLYSIVCQLLKMNSADSLFFTRKTVHSEKHAQEMGVLSKDLAGLRIEKEAVESQYRERSAHMQQLEDTYAQRQQAQDVLVRKFEEQSRLYDTKIAELAKTHAEKEAFLADLDGHLQQKQAALRQVEARVSEMDAAWQQQQNSQSQSEKALTNGAPTESSGHPGPDMEVVPGKPQGPQSKTFELSQMQTPDLSEYADVAVYGAALNGDIPQAPQHVGSQGGQKTADLSEKEKELQRREQALLERERGLRQNGPPNGANVPQNGPQNEPYYDSQTGEQFHDVSSGYQQNGAFNGNTGNPGNPGFNGNYNNAPTYRQAYSLTGNNPYNQPYEGNSYDQRPPHGLPPNGFPQNSLPPTLRNPQRYQQNGSFQQMPPGQQMQQMPQQMQQMPQQMQQRPRVASHNYGGQNAQNMPNMQNMPSSRANSMAPHQQLQQMNQHPQMQSSSSSQYLLNQAAQAAPQGFAGKKNNRRSAFPDQALNIDYGGRGGMPMPTTSGAKHKSMMMGGQSSSPISQQKKSFSGVSPAIQGHLRIPNQNPSSNSDSLTSHGSMTEESPKPSTPDSSRDIRLEVPMAEAVAKPLGGVAPPPDEKKKKKKGLFKKH